ncbi:ATP synthase F1, epsilon subunit [Rippkaea orientalis PCC 8801]|uniref:ATP synthase epsilon chain n=1 Tax=Rippkaea orientalis (strain PCC 8801 / RF-1) TaxID=41431 RepID=ATPE_RIPO1|nr:ATP synthase F1 subunit epsilon [Rippkaea orientalis]B7K2R7.1 RecName: Full=ATP synthase epsilon chain; AltName: Full=ATP synthase F1 sector epsilon subunit; AltName: Full=F-ATPase epsilon subunit [Rippkaea orientalis PCC 8801]ACK67618.1 ATP synthase F1, epsilon subunit [Rippkaea orientalis PCC 8801]
MALQVRVITPDKIVWDGDVEEAILPSTSGQLGILPSHAPLLTNLDIGVMRVRLDKDWKSLVVMGGIAEVEQDILQVLVNSAEIGDDITKEDAQADFSEAQSRLEEANKGSDRREQIKASQAYKRARARLQAAGGLV